MKVKSPIFSDGRGKLGNNVVGSMWKGIWYLRSYVVPANPKTKPQIAVRSIMRLAVADAQDVEATPANKTELNRAALSDGISGFNLFVKDFTGSPVTPDNYSAASITKISGEALSIPRGEVVICIENGGAFDVYPVAAIGGTAPAYEILVSDITGWTPTAGDIIHLGDNRVFPDTVTEAEIIAKATSHYAPDKVTGTAVQAILTA